MGTAFESETFWTGFGGAGSLVGTRSEVLSLVEYGRRGKRRGCRRGRIEDMRAPRIGENMLADGSVNPGLWDKHWRGESRYRSSSNGSAYLPF